MEGLKPFTELCCLAVDLSQSGQKDASWTPLFELSRKLYELFLCSVCKNLVINPFEIISSNCKHTVCEKCIVVEMTRICPSCVPEEACVEEYKSLQHILKGYIHLCKYIRSSTFFRDTVLDNCTSDKLFFISQVTEVANHALKCALTNPDCIFTCNSPTHENSSIELSQASTSRCQTPNETSTESHKKSNKRKRHSAPNNNPKQRVVDETDVGSDSSECESNQNNDKICANQSENSSTCSYPNCSSSSVITSKGCRMSLNHESATILPESSCVKRKFEKSNGKSLKEKEIIIAESCTTRSECSSPEIVFNTLELKQYSYCICNSINELSVSTSCYALNCPCYLNDRACCHNCFCQDCVNPNKHSTASDQVSKKHVKDKTDGLDCSQSIVKVKESNNNHQEDNLNHIEECANIEEFIFPTPNLRSKTKPITRSHKDSVHPSEIINAADSETIVKTACSETIMNTSSSKTTVSTSIGKTTVSTSSSNAIISATINLESCNFRTVLRNVKSNLGERSDKPPLVNCNESPDNPELFDFSRENIIKFLYSDRGTGGKPGSIYTRSSDKKGKTHEPNAEVLQRIDELAKMVNAQAAVNPKMTAYYINLNKPHIPGTSSDEIITIDD